MNDDSGGRRRARGRTRAAARPGLVAAAAATVAATGVLAAACGGHHAAAPSASTGGKHSTPINPGSPLLQSALKACIHLLGLHHNPAQTSAELRGMVKAAACMRARGYPDYPDPTEQNGQIVEPGLPASIDTSSPQFESAMKACNAGT
jgi:hypothetical protein